MNNFTASGGLQIDLLVNGDNLNTRLIATAPLYQTFKKGTQDFSPNWETMPDGDRPIIYPSIRSVMEGIELIPKEVDWKYNQSIIKFGADGIATSPAVVAGKVQEVTFDGKPSLKMIGNVASDINNDSDTISFSGKVETSGQSLIVSSDITVLIEEGANNLYRLFLSMDDDTIDPGDDSLELKAALHNDGVHVIKGVEFAFETLDGLPLRNNDPQSSSILIITDDMIDRELIVVGKAYVDGELVAQEQKQVFDVTDPFVILSSHGKRATQPHLEDTTYTFKLYNARTTQPQPEAVFELNVFSNLTMNDISSEFNISPPSVTVTGAKIREHRSIYVRARASLNK